MRGRRRYPRRRARVTREEVAGKGAARPGPAAKPAPAATPKAVESAQRLLTSAVAALAARDDDHVAIAVDDLSSGAIRLMRRESRIHYREHCEGRCLGWWAGRKQVDILATLLHQRQQEDSRLSAGQEALATTMIENSDNDAAAALYDDNGASSGIDAANQAFGLTETTVGAGGYWAGKAAAAVAAYGK